jgi:hypothetical protein
MVGAEKGWVEVEAAATEKVVVQVDMQKEHWTPQILPV